MESHLFYTFNIPNGIIAKTLEKFRNIHPLLYLSGETGLVRLEKEIINLKPSHILGLGYYRKDIKKIRNEKVFKNVYWKNKIDLEGKDEYFANWEIQNEFVKDTFKAGNSWCNRYAYKTMQILDKYRLQDTKFAYLHVPSDFEVEELGEVIVNLITS